MFLVTAALMELLVVWTNATRYTEYTKLEGIDVIVLYHVQTTGACSCIENVGSDMDDKCCNCTPGYFNFTDQGCQGTYE